jgi:transposase-like protein
MAVVGDCLEALAREGARRILTEAMEVEVATYLGRDRYERSGPGDSVEAGTTSDDGFRGYRNGSSPRKLTLGSGTIDLRVPRVRDVPAGQAPFTSKVVPRYQRRSDHVNETFMRLFIEGLATRDFEPSLRLLMGEEAPLSPSVISRLTVAFKERYEAFDHQDLADRTFVYIWADGIYLKAGLGTEKTCLMVLIGADREGVKHLIAVREGYRESAESWGELIGDCRRRGMNEPACWIGDGVLGLWSAVSDHCPHSRQQRCTNHKTMNVMDKLPLSERSEYTQRLRAVWRADSRSAAEDLAATVTRDLRVGGYDRAARCLEDDLERCLTFYDLPEPHWVHLRTTNVIESPFASVRLRTNAAKRLKKTKSGVYMVYEVLRRLETKWHRLAAPHVCSTIPLPGMKEQHVA